MTPSDIEVLIHCHGCPAPHPRFDAPAVRETLERFRQAGLILPYSEAGDGVAYRTTEGGALLIEALCAVPFPVRKWVML